MEEIIFLLLILEQLRGARLVISTPDHALGCGESLCISLWCQPHVRASHVLPLRAPYLPWYDRWKHLGDVLVIKMLKVRDFLPGYMRFLPSWHGDDFFSLLFSYYTGRYIYLLGCCFAINWDPGFRVFSCLVKMSKLFEPFRR